MSSEPSFSTISETLTERAAHPVALFLLACGLQKSQFPTVRLIVETGDTYLQQNPVFVPLRIPGRSGFVYETYFRVIRVVEVPHPQESQHRRFYEIEWKIQEAPLLESEYHKLFSFISGEVECPDCRLLFIPDPVMIDSDALRISCPSCLENWTLQLSASKRRQQAKLITDSYYSDPSSLRRAMELWASPFEVKSENNYQDYFPLEFEAWGEAGSHEWVFGDNPGFRLKLSSEVTTLENVARSLINHFALKYFSNRSHLRPSSKLETTEVQRKSRVEIKTRMEAQFAQDFLIPDDAITVGASTEAASKEASSLDAHTMFERQSTIGVRQRDETSSAKEITVITAVPILDSRPLKTARVPSQLLILTVSFFLSLSLIAGILSYFIVTRSPREESMKDNSATPVNERKAQSIIEVARPTAAVDEALKPETSTDEAAQDAKAQDSVVVESQVPARLEEEALPTPKIIESAPVADSVIDSVEVEKPSSPNFAKMALIDAGFRQAMLHLKLQQSKEAIVEFEKVIDLDPRHKTAFRNLGVAYVYEKRFPEAIKTFERYLALTTGSTDPDREEVRTIVSSLKERIQDH
ncbi:MAG: hypothetical protein COV44_04855 [Deltaproteobacteria bacterium CG11_big_fil_rev_8_21_14_0_20_45_16]|nr:MAG: hypothetical protein COV44_04855 [Deltaproteobacteria bacterium CG11_big_fil_rev_8_21_14_0_20_45_16]